MEIYYYKVLISAWNLRPKKTMGAPFTCFTYTLIVNIFQNIHEKFKTHNVLHLNIYLYRQKNLL